MSGGGEVGDVREGEEEEGGVEEGGVTDEMVEMFARLTPLEAATLYVSTKKKLDEVERENTLVKLQAAASAKSSVMFKMIKEDVTLVSHLPGSLDDEKVRSDWMNLLEVREKPPSAPSAIPSSSHTKYEEEQFHPPILQVLIALTASGTPRLGVAYEVQTKDPTDTGGVGEIPEEEDGDGDGGGGEGDSRTSKPRSGGGGGNRIPDMSIFDQRHRKLKEHIHARLIPVEVKPRGDLRHGVGQAGQYAQEKLQYIARLLPQSEAKGRSVYSVFTDYDNIVIIQSTIVGFERQTPRLEHMRTPQLPFLKSSFDHTSSTAPPTDGFKALHKLLSASTKELGSDLLSHPEGCTEEDIVGIGGSCVVYKVEEEGKEPMVKKMLMWAQTMPLNGVEDEVETLEHLNASLPPEASAYVPTLHDYDYDSLTISPLGIPLLDLLRSSKSPEERLGIARLVANILPALRHIHEAKVVHQDIRPCNIVVARREVPGGGGGEGGEEDKVREEMVAVLVDWGLAMFMRSATGNLMELAHIGTIDYNVNWGIWRKEGCHRFHPPQADIAALLLVVIFILDWKDGEERPAWFLEWRRQTFDSVHGGAKPKSQEADIHDIRDAYVRGIPGTTGLLASAVERYWDVKENAQEKGSAALERLYSPLDS